jgi:hypothetical protein
MTPSGQPSAIHLRTSLCRPPVPDVRVSEARRAELRDRFDDLYAALNLETALATRRQKIERLAGTQLPACARPPRPRPPRPRRPGSTADGRSGSVPAMVSLSGRRPSATALGEQGLPAGPLKLPP